MKQPKLLLILLSMMLAALMSVSLFGGLRVAAEPEAPTEMFGYGFNVADWDLPLLQGMGFNWMKVFNGPGSRLPVNVLLRIDAHASHMGNVDAFGDAVQQLATQQNGFVDAYEIGNEPNLDASYGWAAPPNAADYTVLLCEAYGRIKAIDPDAKVISAGLAPTGRVTGNWEGHPGHNSLYQDEREFFKEMAAAGAGDCLDGVGYHPYGYSADYNAAPDVASADPTQNCVNGFCFRGAEKLYELMQSHGMGDKTMWATEVGWITQPPDDCAADPGWQGRQWQIVSEQKQASNLVGAFTYAAANYPWMEAMFIFNLNFNTVGWYPECEQMRFYGVEDRLAEAALRDMPKVNRPTLGELAVIPGEVTTVITTGQQPYSQTAVLQLHNIGGADLDYKLGVEAGSPLTVTVWGDDVGTLPVGGQTAVTLTIAAAIQPTGTYTATLRIDTISNEMNDVHHVPITWYIWDDMYQIALPILLKP